MLKKLFKYDWKAFWKVPTAINIFLLVVTTIGILSLVSPFWKLDYDIISVLLVVAVIFYYVAICAGSIAVSVYTAVRYYKNIYTDEGYLTNTLPVTAGQIVLSKLIVGFIWSIITEAVVTVSVLSLVVTAMFSSGEPGNLLDFIKLFPQLAGMLDDAFGLNLFLCLFYFILLIIASSVFSILMTYSAIALGQLFTSHKVAGAVGWYIGEYVIVQIFSSLLFNVPFFSLLAGSGKDAVTAAVGLIQPLLLVSVLFNVLLCIALFFVTRYILQKKLNLE